MKLYFEDFNGILEELQNVKEFEFVHDPRDCDVIVIWNDVRAEMLEIALINEKYIHKPLIMMQHGRGAYREYLPPNKFRMKADKALCWGEGEKDYLVRAGYGDKAIVTGCPLINRIIPKEKHDGKNIVFLPVITMHEEPDNIITYLQLKSIEMKYAQNKLREYREKLRDNWHSWIVDPGCVTEGEVPYHVLSKDWQLVSKITPVHDKKLYTGGIVLTHPRNKEHINHIYKLLSVTDCVIAMEEGTFPLLAMAMDIPVVMVEGFQYKTYGGTDYKECEMIKTDGVRYAKVEDLEQAINEELANPDRLKEQRKKVVERELGTNLGNPLDNVVKVIKETNG